MTSLQSLSKKELLERASLLPHFKKSLAREKKEVLVQFLSAATGATATGATATGTTATATATGATATATATGATATGATATGATGTTIPSFSTVTTTTENAPPPIATTTATSTSTSIEKKKTGSSLSRMSKPELLEACSNKEGFDKDQHGKTKATLLEFLKGLVPTDTKPKDTKPKDTKPKDTKPKDQKQQHQVLDDDGIDPVNVGSLLDTPDDVEAIKSAILRLLMDTAPFQSDPELKAKLDKIV